MMVTNLCTSPSSTITLKADKWVNITTLPSVNRATYQISVEVNVTGGTISIIGADGDINARQRVSYKMIINNTNPISMSYHVKSGNPTVTVTEYAHLHAGGIQGEQGPARQHQIFRRGYDAARLTLLGVMA
jgi:hypothetical protein